MLNISTQRKHGILAGRNFKAEAQTNHYYLESADEMKIQAITMMALKD